MGSPTFRQTSFSARRTYVGSFWRLVIPGLLSHARNEKGPERPPWWLRKYTWEACCRRTTAAFCSNSIHRDESAKSRGVRKLEIEEANPGYDPDWQQQILARC